MMAYAGHATMWRLMGHLMRGGIMHLPKIDERSVGALMMHFMLETILMGKLMGVDPFDQPGVEEGKVLAREYLQNDQPFP